MRSFFQALGWEVAGCIPSPLLGPKGNREFLMVVKRESDQVRKVNSHTK